METLQAGRADQWHMLDAAEARLAELEPSGRVIPWRGVAVPAEMPAPVAASDTPADRTDAPLDGDLRNAPRRHCPTPPLGAASLLAPAPVAAATTADPEFLALFVEEARENVTRLNELFPRWEQNPLDTEALRDMRRAFHTLKGSGRMVGARRVGEFSWSIETLLNRVISQTLQRSPESSQ